MKMNDDEIKKGDMYGIDLHNIRDSTGTWRSLHIENIIVKN